MKRYVIDLDVGGTNIKIALMPQERETVDFCSITTIALDDHEDISDRMISG